VSPPPRSLRHSLAEDLRRRILAGEWRPGERLPSEPELAKRQTVSRSSMRSAITLLEEEGFVRRRQGSGTYVVHRPTLDTDLGRNFGVSSMIAATGLAPATVDETIGEVGAPPAVAAALGVPDGAPITCLRRVRSAGGRRVVDMTDWCRTDHLPVGEFPAGASIYAELTARGLAVHHGVAHLTPGNADSEIARRLKVPRGTLLLTIDQVDTTTDGIPVLVSREHYLADAFDFTLLRRGPAEDTEEER
jgi:GntR family transcriptional regulator